MYQDHVGLLNVAIRHDPDIFCRAVTFAVLSIRQQFPTAVKAMSEVEVAGTKARALWGYKRGAYDFLRKNKYSLWERVRASVHSEDAIDTLATIPGIGIVKAAFVCQMMGHDVGCLDSRNITRLGLNPREWRTDGEERKQGHAFKRKIERYVAETQGQAETLWNDWCEDVGKVYSVSAEEISKDHLVILPPSMRSQYRKLITPVPVVKREQIPFAA